jgi:hypothetical protein
MRRFHPRFTIGSMMLAVVVVAGLLALYRWMGPMVIALPFPCLAGVGAQWVCFRGQPSLTGLGAQPLVIRAQQRFAAFAFWVPAILINVLYDALCVVPEAYALPAMFLGWVVFAGPTIGALGSAWVTLPTCQDATPRRSSAVPAWFAVLALSGMPLVTLWTLWPLHLAFRASRPSLERLADQVATGQVSEFPQWAGLFRIAGSAIEPKTGNVSLMIEPNPDGPTGFVRASAANPQNRAGLFRGGDLCVDLGWGWDYWEED